MVGQKERGREGRMGNQEEEMKAQERKEGRRKLRKNSAEEKRIITLYLFL